MRNLDFFELDLGKSVKLVGKDTFRKLDDFVIRYKKLYDSNILNFGKIGDKIFFYEDLNITNNIILVFNDDDIYEIEYTVKDLRDVRNYIIELIRKIEDIKVQEKSNSVSNIMKNNTNEDDLWVAPDGKVYLVDQTLPKDKYLEQLMKKIG